MRAILLFSSRASFLQSPIRFDCFPQRRLFSSSFKSALGGKIKIEEGSGGNGSENLPSGASLIEDFLSPEEHDELVAQIDAQPWQATEDSLIQRRTQQYGWRYDYAMKGTRDDMFLGELPAFFAPLLARMVAKGLVEREQLFNQVSVNEYVDGRGIGQHTDTKQGFGEAIASVSLLSTIVINFRQPDWRQDAPNRQALLRPRSCLVLRGEARHDWSHGISSKNRNTKQERPPMDIFEGQKYPRSRRIAVTFRTVTLPKPS